MAELVPDPQQSELVAAAGTPIRVLDASGGDVGVLTLTDDAPLSMTIEELARRAAGPRRDWPTTQEVPARIKSRVSSPPPPVLLRAAAGVSVEPDPAHS